MGYREYPNRFNQEYDSWPAKEQWHYERGRQFAAATDKDIPVKTGKQINYRALVEYVELFTRKAIIRRRKRRMLKPNEVITAKSMALSVQVEEFLKTGGKITLCKTESKKKSIND